MMITLNLACALEQLDLARKLEIDMYHKNAAIDEAIRQIRFALSDLSGGTPSALPDPQKNYHWETARISSEQIGDGINTLAINHELLAALNDFCRVWDRGHRFADLSPDEIMVLHNQARSAIARANAYQKHFRLELRREV